MKNLLITGRPGVGKTTLIRNVAGRLAQKGAAGFFTQEIREKAGVRTGFRIETLDGRSGILASVSAGRGPRVGKYRVDVAELERVGVSSIEHGLKTADLIVIDEIGKMELFSRKFEEIVEAAFDSRARVLATIKMGERELLKKLAGRKDTRVYTLSEENRGEALKIVEGFIEERN